MLSVVETKWFQFRTVLIDCLHSLHASWPFQLIILRAEPWAQSAAKFKITLLREYVNSVVSASITVRAITMYCLNSKTTRLTKTKQRKQQKDKNNPNQNRKNSFIASCEVQIWALQEGRYSEHTVLIHDVPVFLCFSATISMK